jgi:NAD-dependent SIR2 family protein deacetylase
MNKTVYILGAGFSVDAGAPTQEKLIKMAFEYKNKAESFNLEKFQLFEDFLKNRLCLDEKQFCDAVIEDMFTPLDSCLANNVQFRGMGISEIINVREAIFYVISRTIEMLLIDGEEKKGYIDKFAKYIVSQSAKRSDLRYRNIDNVSVISTNWDILLDRSLYECIKKNNHKAVVDYCCYISSYEKDDDTIKPGLEMLGMGGFNVKLLKLHGSLNWLQCSRCMRLYVSFSDKIYNNGGVCRHCNKNFQHDQVEHVLTSNLIMPTFMKDLSNPQYKIIWQNAGIEVSEAKKIVFIGYSLPSADFEMRQLLSRMVRKNADIVVVDFIDDTEPEEKKNNKKVEIENRWKTFFGSRKIDFNFSGAPEYINLLNTDGEC